MHYTGKVISLLQHCGGLFIALYGKNAVINDV